MALDYYINTGGKRLRCGYTTGTCAALAAAAATTLLLTGKAPKTLSLITPKGILVEVPILNSQLMEHEATCTVTKDGGDDIDVTDGLPIVATVRRMDTPDILIQGGAGVGRVTKPGLDQSVGEFAINRVPRQMIANAVREAAEAAETEGGFLVTISVPDGQTAALKTFNPQLGVEGGISILGTSGIVEPMSIQAITDTLAIEIRQGAALGAKAITLIPGNYAQDFLKEHSIIPTEIPVIKCSNFIGEGLDCAGLEGFTQVLLVGHVGKLVKLAGGIMNTHSRWGDCRRELFAVHAALCGGNQGLIQRLMEQATTDGCLAVLDEVGLAEQVLTSLLSAVQGHLDRRASGRFQVGAVLFSNQYGLLGQTQGAEEILYTWNKKQ